MPDEIALDTTVLRRANVILVPGREDATLMGRRLSLLNHICSNNISILISASLIQEYQEQIRFAQNDFVKIFIDLVTRPDGIRVIRNWKTSWSGGKKSSP